MWNIFIRIKRRYKIVFVAVACFFLLIIIGRRYWKDVMYVSPFKHRAVQTKEAVVFVDNIYINKSFLDVTDVQFDDSSVLNSTELHENELYSTRWSLSNVDPQQATVMIKLLDLSTAAPSVARENRPRTSEYNQEVLDTGQDIGYVIQTTTKESISKFYNRNFLPEASVTRPLPSQKLPSASNDTLHRVQEQLLLKALIQIHAKPPDHPRRVRGPWQMVEDQYEIYLLSAYYDDRTTLDQPRVTVIAIAEPAASELFCLFWYDTQNRPKVRRAEIISVGPQIAPGGITWYEQFLFSCLLPSARGSTPPINVSIVTPHNIRPSTNLPVQIPLKPASPTKILEFGHCMSVLYWKQDPYKVVEWLELHRIWGIGEVNIYGHALDNNTDAVLRRYHREGFVRYQSIPTVIDEMDELAILLNMSPVLNDCLYRNMYRYKYVVCTDIDEMIVPRGTLRTYSSMLKAIDKSRSSAVSQSVLPPVYSYLFRNAYFFLDFGPVYDSPWWSLTLRYTRRIKPSRFGYSSKSITRTMDCIGLQNHLCWRHAHKSTLADRWNYDVSVLHGLNHHYKKCHFDRYLGKDGECLKLLMQPNDDVSLKRFRVQLSRTVITKLKELILVEETQL